MNWVYLLLAILFEVAGTTNMKLSNGFQKPGPSAAIFICYLSSIGFLTLAIRSIDISVAYAIWCALGIALIAGIGVFFFQEEMGPLRVISLVLIVLGVVGLNLSTR